MPLNRPSLVRWCVLLAVLLAALAVNFTAPVSTRPVLDTPAAVAGPVPKALKTPTLPRLIDPAETFSNGMNGTQSLRGNSAIGNASLRDIHSVAGDTGSSNIFLVGGDSLGEAVWATNSLYGGSCSSSEVVKQEQQHETDIWVGAFLGCTSSTPPVDRLCRVEVDGEVVRVAYAEEVIFCQTCDVHPYFVWANLGRLKPGKYQLELIEVNEKEEEVVLMRKVTVRALPEKKD